jgi:hypothetical protein
MSFVQTSGSADVSEQLFSCRDPECLNDLRKGILAAVEREGYAVVRGLFDEAAIGEALHEVYRRANSAHHRASDGLAPSDVRRNTSKWSIGSRILQDGLGRFVVVLYNPLFDKNIFELHTAFERIIQVRDTIAGRPIQRDAILMPERFNACRIQIYPAGGGFMAEHRDARGTSNLNLGIYIEVLLVLTQKGIDYRRGGGFVRLNGAMVDTEAGTRRGDLIIYDASTIHGVLDVDPDLPFDACNLRGRAVAMATIYDNR